VDELLVRSLCNAEDAYSHPTHQVTGVRIGGSNDPELGNLNQLIDGAYFTDKIIHADHVVLSTTVGVAQKLIRPKFEDLEWFKPMLKLPTMTGITIQLGLFVAVKMTLE